MPVGTWVKCPQCNGKKKITCTVTTYGEKGNSDFDMDCLTCHGKGKVTPDQARAHQAAADAWCTCPEPSEPQYHPDTRRMKHHWTCGTCGKIVQVG